MIRPEISEPKHWDVWKTIGQVIGVLVCLSLLFALLSPIFETTPEHRGPSPCKRNLKQIGLALHNYHDTYKCFPPAFVLGPDGKPWHSWRVLILPFLEERPLFEKYRFDEPWNGPNNSKLLDQRPLAFACHWIDNKTHVPKTDTNFVAVVGSETAWPGVESIRVADIEDGTSNTALVIEVRDAGIPWLAPDDLSFEEASLPPRGIKGRRASSIHFTEADHGGLHVLMGDGTVKFVNCELVPEIWKALLTRAGGEAVADF